MWLSFSERVAYVEGTVRVDIEGPGGAVLKSVTAGGNAPTVTITEPAPNTSFDRDTLRIAWTASDPDGDPLYALVQYSPDNGQTWQSVGLATQANALDVPAGNVAASDSGRFRVLVSDGIHTTVAQVGPIVVANRSPEITLLSPRNGATFLANQTIVLQAFVYDPDEGTLSGDRVVWSSDRDGELGKGDTLPVTGLQVGQHLITVRATDSQGGVSTRTVTVRIVDSPDQLMERWIYLPLLQRSTE